MPAIVASAVASSVAGMRRRTTVTLVSITAVVLVAGGLVTGLGLLRGAGSAGPECTVPAGPDTTTGGSGATGQQDAPLTLDAAQLQHASTINAVGLARGVPERARVIALATAWQESALRNLDHGDRDAVGLFQQRHSQGWGTVAQIMDPVYASGKFYDALLQVPGWQQLPLTKAAQAVQYSAFPDAYAKWERDARILAAALGGTQPVRLSCRAGAVASTAAAPVRPPLAGTGTADAQLSAVLAAAQAELGGLSVVSVASDGHSAMVTASLPDAAAAVAGRALAAWTVAHATTMHVTGVAVADRIWTDHSWTTAHQPDPAGQVRIAIGS
jgi:hypothetical protein